MRYLVDTNTCIGVLTNRIPALTERWLRTPPSQVRLCSVVKAELLYGADKGARAERTRQMLRGFFAKFRSMPFDDAAADHYGGIRASLEAKGQPIGPNDLLIAAIALANDLTVVTHNIDEFQRIDGLKLEDWEA